MAEATEQQEQTDDVAGRVEAMQERQGRGNAAASSPASTTDVRQVTGPTTAVGQDDGPQQLVEQAAHSPKAASALTPEEKLDALQWLLDDGQAAEVTVTRMYELNVGTDDRPKIIEWTIRPLDSDTMNMLQTRARQEAGLNRQARRQGAEPEIDVRVLNLRMVAAATVEPDLQEASRVKGVAAADPLYGPVMLLQRQFAHKPGLIAQIAGQVMLFSGYDDADVRRATPEMTMIAATGNS